MQGYPPQGHGQPGQGHPGQGYQPPAGAGTGRLEIHSSFFPLIMWFLFFTGPRITIDGREEKRSWGTTSFDLYEGVHVVKVHIPNLFGPGGKAERQIQIWPGYTTKLRYSAPTFFAALAGSLMEAGTEPVAQLPAGH